MSPWYAQVAQFPTPAPPLPEPSIFSPQVVESIMIGFTMVAVTIAAIFLLKPLVMALARRLEGKTADPALHGEVEQLREQVAELAPFRERLHELEERMEFTERLLAQRRDQELLPRDAGRELPR